MCHCALGGPVYGNDGFPGTCFESLLLHSTLPGSPLQVPGYCIIDAYMWFGGLMFEVGLYYIASHETTYCTLTPFFSDTVKCIAHGHIIRKIRYSHCTNPCTLSN